MRGPRKREGVWLDVNLIFNKNGKESGEDSLALSRILPNLGRPKTMKIMLNGVAQSVVNVRCLYDID